MTHHLTITDWAIALLVAGILAAIVYGRLSDRASKVANALQDHNNYLQQVVDSSHPQGTLEYLYK